MHFTGRGSSTSDQTGPWPRAWRPLARRPRGDAFLGSSRSAHRWSAGVLRQSLKFLDFRTICSAGHDFRHTAAFTVHFNPVWRKTACLALQCNVSCSVSACPGACVWTALDIRPQQHCPQNALHRIPCRDTFRTLACGSRRGGPLPAGFFTLSDSFPIKKPTHWLNSVSR